MVAQLDCLPSGTYLDTAESQSGPLSGKRTVSMPPLGRGRGAHPGASPPHASAWVWRPASLLLQPTEGVVHCFQHAGGWPGGMHAGAVMHVLSHLAQVRGLLASGGALVVTVCHLLEGHLVLLVTCGNAAMQQQVEFIERGF